jgi:biofilm PGA synthesis protein PgaD
MNPDEKPSLIIDRPDWVRPGQKFTALGVTLVFWGALLYLWQPLLSLLAWGLNIHLFYNHMIVMGGYEAFLNLLAFYALVILILGGGLILWARINLWRFRGKNRRNGVFFTEEEKLCRDFEVSAEQLAELRAAQKLTVKLTPDGRIERFSSAVYRQSDE